MYIAKFYHNATYGCNSWKEVRIHANLVCNSRQRSCQFIICLYNSKISSGVSALKILSLNADAPRMPFT